MEQEDKSEGGIIIPDTAKGKPLQGKVIAIGSGRLLQDGSRAKPEVAVGDLVIFSKFAGTEVQVDGKDDLLIKEDDILGIIET